MFDYFKDGFWHGVAYWIYDFQTLISGLAAVMAAIFTICQVRKQTRDDLTRRNWSARANANWALSDIASYSDNCVLYVIELNKLKNDKPNQDSFEPTISCPVFPKEAVSLISIIVETSTKTESEILANFLSYCQLLGANTESLLHKMNGTDGNIGSALMSDYSFYNAIYYAMIVQSYCERVYPYVRDTRDGKISSFSEKPNMSVTFNTTLFLDKEFNSYIGKQDWPPDLRREMDAFAESMKSD